MATGILDPSMKGQPDEAYASGWRGMAILIGNDYKCLTSHQSLEGPKRDILLANRVFSGFGGLCVKVENKSAKEIKEIIKAAALKPRHPCSYEWIVVVFSGHGEDGGALIANDGKPIYIQTDIIDPFQPKNASPEIAKIPKFFFIDACRGSEETHGILVPRAVSDQDVQPRGGNGLNSLLFPPEGNMLIAFPTMPSRKSYECKGEGGIWMNKVLTRLEKEDLSVTDILQMVNKDILDYFQQESMESRMQQAEYRCSIIGIFKFKKTSFNSLPRSSDVQPTQESNQSVDTEVDTRPRNMPKSSSTPRQIPRANVKNNEWLQELKNVLVDQCGYKISDDNYKINSPTRNPPKFQCTFIHECFPKEITGEWRRSKQDAKQSVAKRVLEYFYTELQ